MQIFDLSFVTEFDPAEYLDSEEARRAYLEACAEENNPDLMLSALADVERSRKMFNKED